MVQFLSNRSFTVRVDNYESESEDVTGEVSQDSALGSFLFFLFISDLVQELDNPCFIFAYGIKLAGEDISRDLGAVQGQSSQ